MKDEERELLFSARKMVSKNPALFGDLIMACTMGIEERVSFERQRAADFETIAAAFMAIGKDSRKTPSTMAWAENLIKQKMLKWEGKTALNFEEDIKDLRG